MDEDWLRREVRAWAEEGIVTESQAQAILARYGLAEEPDAVRTVPRSRIVTVVSAMGALLVGAGVLAFLAANWPEIPRPVRLAIVLGTTGAFLASGWVLRYRRGRPLAGHVLLALGSVAIGVALFLVNELYALTGEVAWLFLSWFALALPLGHAARSRPIVLVGLAAAGGWVGAASAGPSLLPVGLFALSLFGVSVLVRDHGHAGLSPAYRLAAIAGTLLVTLAVLAQDVDLVTFGPDISGFLAVLFAAAVAAVAGVMIAATRRAAPRTAAVWCTAALVTLGGATVLGILAPDLFSELGRVLVWNGLGVVLLVATVALGYVEESPVVVNLAVVAFLVQLGLVLVSTVLDVLPGSAALVVAGITLLAVGIGLERGRRELLDRMAR